MDYSMNLRLKSLFFAFSFIFMGCSLQEDMDEMRAISKDLDRTANQAIRDARTATMLALNLEAFKNIMSAKTLEQKILHARVYVRTFELQAWTGKNFDTPEYLEDLEYVALKKFYADLTELVRYDAEFLTKLPPIERPVETEEENLVTSAYAIAISIDETNEQIITNRSRGLRGLNILELLYEGVTAFKAGIDQPSIVGWRRHFEATFLDIELAKIILQIRYNSKILKFIKMVSPVDLVKAQSNPLERAKLDKMFSKPWHADFKKLPNTVVALHALELLDYAVEVRHVFESAFDLPPADINITGNKLIKRFLSDLVRNMNPPRSEDKIPGAIKGKTEQALAERMTHLKNMQPKKRASDDDLASNPANPLVVEDIGYNFL
jgi:hypothetical protein